MKTRSIPLDITGPIPNLTNRQIGELLEEEDLLKAMGEKWVRANFKQPERQDVSLPLFPTVSDAPECCQTVGQLIALENDSLALEDLERVSRTP